MIVSCKPWFAALVIACSGASHPKTTTPSAKHLVLVDDHGVGLQGHDPVSYASGASPVRGSAEHASAYGGATYWFASGDARSQFDADKPKFAPQYGGYCALAASQNRLSDSDPTVFQLHNGQLLVFTNADFRDQFNKDAAGNKAKADANWPGLVAKHGTRSRE